jgi:cation transport regulator ChaC
MGTYIFGYGSLLSRVSRHRTFVESVLHENVEFKGYQRILNACCDDYLVMNIQPHKDVSIWGVVAKVVAEDFPALREREYGYDLIEVT